METKALLQSIVKERPVGTENNKEVLDILKRNFLEEGYNVDLIPFNCLTWEKGNSFIQIGSSQLMIKASPYSASFEGEGEIIIIESLEALQTEDLRDKIVILCGAATQNPVQPKNHPFYYPDEDRAVIERLENQKPKAIVAMTGQSQLSGLNPFPMFEDGNFAIPSAYLSEEKWRQIRGMFRANTSISLKIDSKTMQVESGQLIAKRKIVGAKGKVIVCAHMDTKYDTMGALDNATGIGILITIMEKLKGINCNLDIDFVPFNSEEYFGANGELSYLAYLEQDKEKVSLVINIDSPCHIHSNTAVSYYNIDKEQEKIISELMQQYEKIEKGEAWYAGDHCAFAFNGIPCLAISSSDLFEGALVYTHTPKDTLETIDETLVEPTADFLVALIEEWSKR